MTAKILDGRAIAGTIHDEVSAGIRTFYTRYDCRPKLAVILLGSDPASQVYIKNKAQACDKVGITSEAHRLAESTSEEVLLELIEQLNADPEVHGILVQLPLPDQISVSKVLASIDPRKDVDGFHPFNVGALSQRTPLLRPCTPRAVMELLAHTKAPLHGLEMVIIGASNIVGRPLALEALLAGCTVTVCHRFSKDIKAHIARADCIVSAVGKPQLIPGEWVPQGAIVIDVGINRLPDGKLVGDLEFEAAQERASWITPVPGGVGPMTVAMLMQNTLQAMQIQCAGQSIESLIKNTVAPA